MTTASKKLIELALAAYEKLDTDERDVFEYVIKMRNPEPAPRRGRPRKDASNGTSQAE